MMKVMLCAYGREAVGKPIPVFGVWSGPNKVVMQIEPVVRYDPDKIINSEGVQKV